MVIILGSEVELRVLEVLDGVEGCSKSQKHRILLATFDLGPSATKDAHLATSKIHYSTKLFKNWASKQHWGGSEHDEALHST